MNTTMFEFEYPNLKEEDVNKANATYIAKNFYLSISPYCMDFINSTFETTDLRFPPMSEGEALDIANHLEAFYEGKIDDKEVHEILEYLCIQPCRKNDIPMLKFEIKYFDFDNGLQLKEIMLSRAECRSMAYNIKQYYEVANIKGQPIVIANDMHRY